MKCNKLEVACNVLAAAFIAAVLSLFVVATRLEYVIEQGFKEVISDVEYVSALEARLIAAEKQVRQLDLALDEAIGIINECDDIIGREIGTTDIDVPFDWIPGEGEEYGPY